MGAPTSSWVDLCVRLELRVACPAGSIIAPEAHNGEDLLRRHENHEFFDKSQASKPEYMIDHH